MFILSRKIFKVKNGWKDRWKLTIELNYAAETIRFFIFGTLLNKMTYNYLFYYLK